MSIFCIKSIIPIVIISVPYAGAVPGFQVRREARNILGYYSHKCRKRMHAYNLTMVIKWQVCKTKLSIIVKNYNKLDRSKNNVSQFTFRHNVII
jgi:hypothetical protein